MEDINTLFNDYVEEFKQLDKVGKYKEIMDSIKELIASITILSELDEYEIPLLKSREINDLNKETTTDDDYLEAIFVYTEVAKAQIGEYLLYLNTKDEIENTTE